MNHEPIQERRDHVVRSMLPWRLEPLTECGCRISDVENVIALDELDDRIERDGLEPTASTVCVMCWQTSRQSARWETNPIGVIAREAVRAGLGGSVRADLGSREPSSRPEACRFGNELRAIAALIDAHRDEFDDYLAGLESTVNIRGGRRESGEGTSE
jgi:hypothetical protein